MLDQDINQYFSCDINGKNLSFGEQYLDSVFRLESLERLTNKRKGVENYCLLSRTARADAGSAAKRSKSHRKGTRVQSRDETSPRFMCTVKTCSFYGLQFPQTPLLFFSLFSHVHNLTVSPVFSAISRLFFRLSLSLSLVQDWVGGNNGDICFLETSSEDADI